MCVCVCVSNCFCVYVCARAQMCVYGTVCLWFMCVRVCVSLMCVYACTSRFYQGPTFITPDINEGNLSSRALRLVWRGEGGG